MTDALPASLAARYDIEGPIGAGATAVVYRGIDRELKRPVAIKLLKPELAGTDQLRQRFLREGRITAGLSHPNLIALYDAGEADGALWMVMELIEGQSLADLLRLQARDLRRLARILAKSARAVATVHQAGIVHRDLKPANILITAGDEPKVGDFGLAHMDSSQADLTRTGTALGTPLYMAPEQVRDAKTITPRADVHALGAILYECATGRPPFLGLSIAEIYAAITNDDPIAPRRINSAVPFDLETIILTALEKRPEARYTDAAAMADDLDAFLADRPIHARRAGMLARATRAVGRRRAVLFAVLATLIVATLVLVPLSIAISRRNAEVARARVRDEAFRSLDDIRTILDQASLILYSRDADYDELVRKSRELRAPVEEALAKAPDLALGHTLLGRLWDIEGWPERAEPEWRRAIELDPDASAPRIALARLLIERGYLLSLYHGTPDRKKRVTGAEAVTELKAAIDSMSRGRGSDPVQLDLARAILANVEQDRDTALQLVNDGIQRHLRSNGVEDFYWLRGAFTSGPDAIEPLTKALEIRPKSAFFLLSRAMTWAQIGEHAKAVDDFTACIRLRPRFFEAWFNRATSLATLNRMDEAVRDCEEALKLIPHHPRALSNRAMGRAAQGELRPALLDFDASLALSPDSKIYCQRARLHARLDQWDSALADVDEALRLDNANDDAWYLRANAAVRDVEWAKALDAIDRAIALRDLPAYRRVRAQVLMSFASRRPEAERPPLLERALTDVDAWLVTNGKDFDVLYNRGRILAQLSRWREATTALELALRHAPNELNRTRVQAVLDAVRDRDDNK